MNTWSIPIEWTVESTTAVRARTLEEAVQIAEREGEASGGEYVDGSFRVPEYVFDGDEDDYLIERNDEEEEEEVEDEDARLLNSLSPLIPTAPTAPIAALDPTEYEKGNVEI